jgi:hypothetical protein
MAVWDHWSHVEVALVWTVFTSYSVMLLAGFIRLGAPEDHEATIGLGELIVFLLGTVC